MEYKLVRKKNKGKKVIRDSVKTEGKFIKHFQVETRNGNVFMRMKTRKIPSRSRSA